MISTAWPARLFFFSLLALLAGGTASAESGDERSKVAAEIEKYRFKQVTTPEGLNFTIPEDMPIEMRNGLKGPIPFDEYIYYKMRKLDEKMTDMDKKIDGLEASLAQSFKELKQQLEAKPAAQT